MPCSREEMANHDTQLPAPEHVTTGAPGVASDAHIEESPAASSPSPDASGGSCINGHQTHESDNFCTVCGDERSVVNVNALSCPSVSFCMAVDGNGNAYSYEGGGWSSGQLVAAAGGLSAVSCTSGSFCIALDSNNDNAYSFK
jgi:hypothetical protein